jgi:hypothetical protein
MEQDLVLRMAAYRLIALPMPFLLRIDDQQSYVPLLLGEFSKVAEARVEVTGTRAENFVSVVDA